MSEIEILRLEEDKVLLPILTYQRRDQSVVLVGIMHFAKRNFYDNLASLLEEHEARGYAVLYEAGEDAAILSLSANFTNNQKRVFEQILAYYQTAYDTWSREYGIFPQARALRVKNTWIRADVSDQELVRLSLKSTQEDDLDRLLAFNLKQARRYAQNPREYLTDYLWAFKAVASQSKERKNMRELMQQLPRVTQRDKHALSVIMGEVQRRPVITYWGAGHLFGLDEGLRDEGFSLTKTGWVEVISLTLPTFEE
jgi:hypothetical protein